jgi:hypothetical protein
VAVKVAANGGTNTDVVNAVKTAVDGWYFFELIDTPEGTVKYYTKNSASPPAWVSANLSDITSGKWVAVEIKLTGLSTNAATKHYWLLPQFNGVSDGSDKWDSFTVSSKAIRK